eukprot:286748-Hanusia_phi.AAC.1
MFSISGEQLDYRGFAGYRPGPTVTGRQLPSSAAAVGARTHTPGSPGPPGPAFWAEARLTQ